MGSDKSLSYHPLLPKLKAGSNNSIANFKENGIWDRREMGELNRLSESLKVERVATQINSIPDVWARPLLFEMALYDREHLLHSRTVAEWRGLLALLCFKEVKNFNIRIVEVLPEDNNENEVWPPFLKTLLKLAPNERTLDKNTLWMDQKSGIYPNIVLYNNQTIGILSPTTLVCTATDCYNRLNGISWSDGRFLKDPSGIIKEGNEEKHLEINENEKKQLASWLQDLHSKLSSLSNLASPNSRLNTLLSLLSDYAADLGGATGTALSLSTTGFGLEKGVFKYFDKPIRGDTNGLPGSYLRLLPSDDQKPDKTIYIVDKTIGQQWNMVDMAIVVYRGATLADVPIGGLGRERKQIGNLRIQDNEELCLPEDIFTNKLFMIYQESALPGGLSCPGTGSIRLGNQVITPLLPLTDKILSHINNEDMQKGLTFEQSSESIHVRLRLKLSGPEGTGKIAELRKEYKKADQEILEGVPVLEVWPNFRKSGWASYYSYFSKAGRESTFYAKPYASGDIKARKTITGGSKKTESEVNWISSFPTALLCYALSPSIQVSRMDERYAGLILLKIPEVVADTSVKWRIGVDFGTTSTSVYTACGDNQGEPLKLRKELISQVTASGSDRPRMYDEFIPGNEEEIPFLSFYQDYRSHEKGELAKILLDGHIFYLDDSKPLEEIPKNVATNLKWSDDALDRERTTSFLEQVCIQSLAEIASRGASQVSWRYSYPTAFAQIVSSGLPQKWQQITKRYHLLTGIERLCPTPQSSELANPQCRHGVNCDIPDHAAQKISESNAAAVYFADELHASTKYGTICIDIGGGTSDIAIWQENELRYQVSLRLAGREILLNTLRCNPDFLGRFNADTALFRRLKQTTDFYAQAEALIWRYGDKWRLEVLPNLVGEAETKKLIQIIALGLSGLFYYIGTVLRLLIEQKKYRTEVPNIYVGGNGSKMFHWLAAGSYDSAHPINNLLRQVLYSSSGLSPLNGQNMNFILSPSPKCEAARGLLGKKRLSIAPSASEEATVISGERISIQGKELDENVLLTSQSFKNSIELPEKLEKLGEFLGTFNRYASQKAAAIPTVDLGTVMEDVRKRLGGKLKDLSIKDEKEISVEPVFVLALKTLLEKCQEEWKR